MDFGNEKGEMSSTQIATLILAIAAFIVVAVFTGLLFKDKSQATDEVCRISVLTRATSPIESLNANIPLKCRTKKICISKSGREGSCEEFIGEENVRYVKLNEKSDKDNARMIDREYADAMYQCWAMMGQGKLNIFTGSKQSAKTKLFLKDILEISQQKHSTCIICSRVVLADDVSEEIRGKINVNEYMKTNGSLPNSELSYLGYFSGARDFDSYPEGFFLDNENKSLSRNYPDQTAFVFMQILTEKGALEAFGDASLRSTFIIGGSIVGSPIGWITKSVGVIPTAILSLLAIGTTGTVSALNADANQQIAAGYCGHLTNEGSERSEGCSIIKASRYTIADINKFCGILEGDP